MDLFSLIMNYLYNYVFYPIALWSQDMFRGAHSIDNMHLFLDDGKFSLISNSEYIKNINGVDVTFVGFNLVDLLVFITTIVIFILLFIVAVKFIVWLFKQISFVTRF